MRKLRDFTVPLTNNDFLDVRLIIEKGLVKGFVLNYRTKLNDVCYQIYRVDTCQDYLHEQRFWQSPEPISLPKFEGTPLKFTFDFFIEEIKNNFERYKKYYIERMGLRK